MRNQKSGLLSRIIIAFSMCTLIACAQFPNDLRLPAVVPISLKESGDVFTKTIDVVDHNNYYFSLRFSYNQDDQVDRARVRGLLGGHEIDKQRKPLEPGVSTPVLLTVYAMDAGQEVEVFKKEIDPILTSWGGDNFKKTIGFTELKPGRYLVQLKSLRACPEFNQIPVALSIGYDKFKIIFVPKE